MCAYLVSKQQKIVQELMIALIVWLRSGADPPGCSWPPAMPGPDPWLFSLCFIVFFWLREARDSVANGDQVVGLDFS